MKSLRLNKEMRETILSNFVDKYVAANPAPVSANEPPIDLEDDTPFNRFMSGKLAYAV